MPKIQLFSAQIWGFLFLVFGSFATVSAQGDFTASATSGCAPLLNVTFTAQVPAGATNISWNLPGAPTGSPVVTSFALAGNYTITMTYVVNGNTQTVTKPNFITVFANPTVQFTANDTSICQGESVTFTPTTTGAAITSWNWSTGIGSSTQQSPTVQYTAIPPSGQYTISVNVTDVNGCTATTTRNDYIAINATPSATFTNSPSTGCTLPTLVTFTSTGAFPTGSAHSWTFAPGVTGQNTAATITHNYTTAGTYDVTQIIVTPAGCRDTFTQVAAVQLGLALNPNGLIVSDTTPCIGQQVDLFYPQSANTSISWNPGTGATPASATSFTPSFTYSTAGPKTITYTLTDNITGCTGTGSKTIVVDPGPIFTFTVDVPATCLAPHTVNLTINTTPPGQVLSIGVDWGDGTTNNLFNHTYALEGGYDITLTATNSAGCTAQVSQLDAVVIEPPQAIISSDKTGFCVPGTVAFTADSSFSTSPIVFYSWTFQGGSPASSLNNNESVTYSTPGTYPVSLYIENADGCVSTQTINNYIRVGTPPTPNFTVATPMPVCASTLVQFTNTSTPTGAGVTYKWDFGDNTTSPVTNASHNYDTIGVFNVKLIVSNNGCRDSITQNAVVEVVGPVADFTFAPNLICTLPDTVQFTAQVQGTVSSYLWNFGTLGTSTVANPQLIINTPNVYPIKLKVTGGTCTDSITKNITANNIVPQFTTDVLSGCAPLTVNMDATLSGGTIYSWTVTPVSTPPAILLPPNQPISTAIFELPGTYTLRLNVKGPGGSCSSNTQKTIQVNGATIDGTPTPLTGCNPLNVNFAGIVVNTTPANTPITSWQWDFGDGTALGSGQNVSHTYTQAGGDTFGIKLTIVDANGCTTEKTLTDSVMMSEPIADFSVNYPVSCKGIPVTFTSSSSGSGLYSLWTFGAGQGTGNTLTNTINHTYTANGNFQVCLQITDVFGCKDTLCKPAVTVSDIAGNFTVSDSVASCPPLTVTFTGTQTTNHTLVNYEWFPTNSSALTGNPSTYTYTLPGTYSPSLILTSNAGCKDTVTKVNKIVIQGPTATYTLSPKQVCPGSPVTLSAVGTPDVTLYNWIVPGGNPANPTGQNTTTSFATPGVYYPLIQVSSANCVVTMPAIDSVRVFQPPVADFTVSDTVSCIPGIFSFTNASTPGSAAVNTWNWNLDNNQTPTGSTVVGNYNNPGQYDITLIVTDANGCKDTLTRNNYIRVANNSIPATPVVRFMTVDGDNQVRVLFRKYNNVNNDFSEYRISRSDNGGAPVQVGSVNVLNDTLFVDNTVVTPSNTYTYSVSALNICNNPSPLSAPQGGMNVSSLPLPGAVRINWTPYVGTTVSRYRVYRVSDYDTTNVQLLATLNGNIANLTYKDSTGNHCGTPFKYRIKANIAGGQVAWSDTTAELPGVSDITVGAHISSASVENNTGIRISWNAPAGMNQVKESRLERNSGGLFVPLATIPYNAGAFDYLDNTVDVNNQIYVYRAIVVDSCGNETPTTSRTGQNMVLKSQNLPSSIALNWTRYKNWAAGVKQYDIELFDVANQTWIKIATQVPTDTSFVDSEIRLAQPENCYRIVALEKSGTGKSISNQACGSLEALVFCPTAFTPNGDGKNDEYTVIGKFVSEYSISIYSKWGALVFTSNDINKSWNGKTMQGVDAPEGVYTYRINAKGVIGVNKDLVGTITLYR